MDEIGIVTGKVENFFLPDGYVCNDLAGLHSDSQLGGYWTGERIRQSSRFQYHVYKLAARLARKRGLQSCMDLGCGPGTKAHGILAPVIGDIVLIDQESCRTLAGRLFPADHFYAVDLERCELSLQRQVDLIVCADVLEHLMDPSKCLEFAFRHLKDSGIAIFSTPERDIVWGRGCMRSMHSAHVREWNRAEFRQLLEWKDFTVLAQQLLPAAILPRSEEFLRRVGSRIVPLRRWRACQAAICRKDAGRPVD